MANNENHSKDPTETRYTKWLEGMDGELPSVERKKTRSLSEEDADSEGLQAWWS